MSDALHPPPHPARAAVRPRTTPIGKEEKARLVEQNRDLLVEDLWSRRLEFRSRPQVVDLQFSNFCNMSCVMCYDGNNPPLLKMREEDVEAVGAELFPAASLLVPFAASEPLIVTWDTTRRMAELYDLELDIVTNGQFLDEKKFAELEPHVALIVFSLDSHIREVYERIRLRSKPDKVFRNLPIAVRLCREHGIEPQANIVFMTENGMFLDDTVAWLADIGIVTVRVLEYLHSESAPPHWALRDPVLHMSKEWMDDMRRRVREVARDKRIRVFFDGQQREEIDHLPTDLTFRKSRKVEQLRERVRRFYPGYCIQFFDHIKVHANGDAYPCCVADDVELRLGNVLEQPFEEVWNGPDARDLRRGMLTQDLPAICRSCPFHLAWIPDPQREMPFLGWYHDRGGNAGQVVGEHRWNLRVTAPTHLLRTEDPPTFCWEPPPAGVDHYELVLAVGGEHHDLDRVYRIDGAAEEFTIPAAEWEAYRANTGYWWTLFAVAADPAASLRAPEIRCVVRHEPIPRITDSKLYESRRDMVFRPPVS